MRPHIFLLVLKCFLVSGSSTNVHQSPPEILVKEGQSSEVQCSHSVQDYNRILWYKQLPGTAPLQFLGYMNVNDPYPEPGAEVNMTGGAAKDKTCILTIKSNIESAKYFCAASKGNLNEAYFGAGTKLTVVEKDHDIRPPTVKLFPPSALERPRRKGDPRLKTLVCVAQDFYPDHVEVSWAVNREAREERVSTDTSALRTGRTYRLSSRLVVPADEWSRAENCFSCSVGFFNGTNTEFYSDAVCGNQGDAEKDGGTSREKYLRTTQNAKLSYTVLIVKSAVYGLFVAFLIWKFQRQNEKRN